MASIPIPQTLTFVSVDFEHEALADQLIEAGFDPALPSLFVWLGVTYYLNEECVAATLRYIGSLPAAEIVFDFINPLPEDRVARGEGDYRIDEFVGLWISESRSEPAWILKRFMSM